MCCRERDAKVDLLRFVVQDGQIVWDRRYRLPGRGAYMHGRVGCWRKIPEVKLWSRAFRLRGSEIDSENLRLLMELLRQEVKEIRSEGSGEQVWKRVRL